jgi:hypothetical protein
MNQSVGTGVKGVYQNLLKTIAYATHRHQMLSETFNSERV